MRRNKTSVNSVNSVGELTQPSHLCKSVKSVGGLTQPNFCEFCEFRGRTYATKPSVQIREICGRTYATKLP